jgi:hypothetical protein
MMRISSGNLSEFAPPERGLFERICVLAGAALLFACFTGSFLSAQSASANDEEYGKKIREFTTEPFFLTDLVDHLPASATVPSPDKILGHIVGAPDFLTYSSQPASESLPRRQIGRRPRLPAYRRER